MTTNAHALLRSLPTLPSFAWNSETRTLDPIEVTPEQYAFVREGENVLRVSAENEYGFADYWGSLGESMNVCDALEEWAEKHGGFWEWENPSNIAFYR